MNRLSMTTARGIMPPTPADTRSVPSSPTKDVDCGLHLAEDFMPTVATATESAVEPSPRARRELGVHPSSRIHSQAAGHRCVLVITTPRTSESIALQNQLYLEGTHTTPDITARPLQVTGKCGFAFNFDRNSIPGSVPIGRSGGTMAGPSHTRTPRSTKACSSDLAFTATDGIAGMIAPEWHSSPTQSNVITSSTWRSADSDSY